MKKTIAVDLDGTIARYTSWKGIHNIGEPIVGARDFLQKLSEFANILIYTTRSNAEVNKLYISELKEILVNYLNSYNLKYDDIWVGQGKPVCAAIVDDRAISCRPQVILHEYSRVLNECLEFVRD